eukprot:9504143-Pyramimonas_sp.AAC.2
MLRATASAIHMFFTAGMCERSTNPPDGHGEQRLALARGTGEPKQPSACAVLVATTTAMEISWGPKRHDVQKQARTKSHS